MKFKIIFLVIAMSVPAKDYAQTPVNRSVAIQPGQTVEMHFDYPRLIRISTWEKNEILITGSVNINEGENDDAFILESESSGEVVSLRAEIKGLKDLPHRVTIMDGEKKIMFRDKAELRKYQETHGKNFNSMSWGPQIEVELEIKVPRNTATRVTSVYGMVEVANFSGPLQIDATYGGVDAALVERSVGELTAATDFGQIFSNLDLALADREGRSRDFHTSVSAKPGNGPRYAFESKYGNVYLRKAGN